MSDLFGNHIVDFPTRWLILYRPVIMMDLVPLFASHILTLISSVLVVLCHVSCIRITDVIFKCIYPNLGRYFLNPNTALVCFATV